MFYKKTIFGLILASIYVFSPLPTFAQSAGASGSSTAGLQAQINAMLIEVKALQAKLGQIPKSDTTTAQSPVIVQTGDVDPEPPESFCVSLGVNMRYRMTDVQSGGQVSLLQDFLQSQGYLQSEPTGFFGLLTFQAVKSFQKSVGITPTGFVGPVTREKVKEISCGGTVIPTGSSITVLSPNGGESWETGKTYTVSFYHPKTNESSLVYLERYHSINSQKAGEINHSILIGSVATGQQSILYTLPNDTDPADTYKIKVCDSVCRQSDSSDNYFGIIGNKSEKSIYYSVTTNKPTYSQDEKIEISISATNNSGEEKILHFNSGCQVVYAVAYFDSSANQNCTLALTAVTIAPYSAKTWYLTHIPTRYKIPVGQHKFSAKVLGFGEAVTLITITPTTKSSIIPSILSNPEVGKYYSERLTAQGFSSERVSWKIVAGALPAGLFLASSGGLCVDFVPPNAGFCLNTNETQIYGTPSVAGNFKFTVQASSASQTTEQTYLLTVSGTTPITVLSPNGGETWQKGTTQTIKWQDNTTYPPCREFAPCIIPPQKFYDIKLASYSPPCTGPVACITYTPRPYTIAKSVGGNSYSWSVGRVLDINLPGSGGGTTSNVSQDIITAPDGSYIVQVCQSGAETPCDSSDSYFKITSGNSTNNPPKIVSANSYAGTIQPGQTVQFGWNATDADNDDLSWSVDWGDSGGAGSCSSVRRQTGTGWRYNAIHAWNQPGTYQVKATVSDCVGGSDSYSVIVTVGGPANNLSPIIDGVSGPVSLSVNETGSWSVKAHDPENGALSYSVDWGDTTQTGVGHTVPLAPAAPILQTSTFTHRYANNGSYTVKFTVTDNAGLNAQSSITVQVGNTQPSITVLSPNGEEVWVSESVQVIKWSNKISSENVPRSTVSIELLSRENCVLAPCFSQDATGMPHTYFPPYIGKDVPNTGEYAWKVGQYTYGGELRNTPVGEYRVRICAGSVCDDSNSYFKITTGATGKVPPCGKYGDVDSDGLVTSADVEIIRLHVLNTRLMNEEQKARADVSGDGLISTLDITTINGYLVGTLPTFPVCTKPSLTVLSPNGGETWKIGEQRTVQLTVSGAPADSYFQVSLADGPTPIGIRSFTAPNGVVSFDYTLPKTGCWTDICSNLQPGSYKLKGILYDKEPCNLRYPCTSEKFITGDASDSSFTITSAQAPILQP